MRFIFTAAAVLFLFVTPAGAAMTLSASFDAVIISGGQTVRSTDRPSEFTSLVGRELSIAIDAVNPEEANGLRGDGVISGLIGHRDNIACCGVGSSSFEVSPAGGSFLIWDFFGGNDWGSAQISWSHQPDGSITGHGSVYIYQPLYGDTTYESVWEYQLELANGRVRALVPEPTTWVLMIAGFGLAGAAVRRTTISTASFSRLTRP